MDKRFTIDPVTEFEQRIAEFFGAPFGVATDSCTHAIELCLRMKKVEWMVCPDRTYLSIPMLANKLGIKLQWYKNAEWLDYYLIEDEIYDAAVFWKRDGYIEALQYVKHPLMCLSFQYQKHLSLGRGGMILCDDKEAATQLKKMSYDGRLPNIPWRQQNIDTFGYHYYMTLETAQLGLDKLDEAIRTEPRKWTSADYPLLTEMEIFK